MKKLPQLFRRVHTPTVFQSEPADCGAACLRMILRYYGCHVSLEELRYACSVSRDGSNAAWIVIAAREYGLQSSGYRVSRDRLPELPLPCILHWNKNHFVVLDEIRKKDVWINDPAQGRIRITRDELAAHYSGVALVFKPGENFQKVPEKHSVWQGIKESLSVFRGVWGYLTICGITMVFPGLILPLLTKTFLDQVVIGTGRNWLGMVLAGIGAMMLCQAGLGYLRTGVLSRLKIAQTLESDHRLIDKLLHLPVSYYEQHFAGELNQREESVERIYEFLSGSMADIVLNLFQALFFFLLMCLFSPLLSVISLAGSALTIGILAFVNHRLAELSVKQTLDRNRLMGLLCSGLSLFSTLKSGSCENDYYTMLMDQYAVSTESDMKLTRTSQILGAVPSTMFQMLNVLMLMIGSTIVIRGSMTIGTLTAFCQVLVLFLAPVGQMLTIERQLQTLKADLDLMEDVYEAKDDPAFTVQEKVTAGGQRRDEEKTEGKPVHPLEGNIEARHLRFGYLRDQPMIKDFSLTIPSGSRIGIVGTSGCGKSTVGKLLTGLLTPWSGEVLMDGIPLSEIPREVRSESVSVVSQKAAFFSGSVRDNLTFWNSDVNEQNIFWALIDAEALGMVNELNRGLEHFMKEGGRNFSGGQLQQLAIARALMNDPAIFLLDEATSSMDLVLERKILNNLKRRSCTCVIIAHRLSTVRDCDLILVMRDGYVEECGKHEELMAAGGLYSHLYSGKEGSE